MERASIRSPPVTSDAARAAFDDLVQRLEDDLEEGLGRDGAVLTVHGAPFAVLDGDDLVVPLPDARVADLLDRGVALPADAADGRARVRVADTDLWEELAREAHDHVGEPPVGRDS